MPDNALKHKLCAVCGQPFYRRRADGKRLASQKWRVRKYCSDACRLTEHPSNEPVARPPCPTCGDPAKRGQTYCSRKCYGAAITRTPTHPRAGRWQARRRYPLQPCQVCGTSDRIHRHHINRNPMDNRPENIAFLCETHHKAEHAQG